MKQMAPIYVIVLINIVQNSRHQLKLTYCLKICQILFFPDQKDEYNLFN